MARIPGVPEAKAGFVARYLFKEIRKQAGGLADTWPIAAHVPQFMRGFAAFEWFMSRTSLVDAKLKRLANLKVSVMIGCPT